jgi:hypothetical protein
LFGRRLLAGSRRGNRLLGGRIARGRGASSPVSPWASVSVPTDSSNAFRRSRPDGRHRDQGKHQHGQETGVTDLTMGPQY